MRSILTLVALTVPTVALANPYSVVPSGGETGSAGDFSVAYEYTLDKSVISRERVGQEATVPGAIATRTDLLFHQYAHTITPRVELGVFADTWISVALPIIVTQSRELQLADGVDREGSATLQDNYVPTGGYDANDPTTAPGGDLVFRGIDRQGLSQVQLGLATAFMNQRRDPTKPTWKFGAEVWLSVGKTMDFDPQAPGDRTGVSSGVHELKIWTTMDRKIGRFEPWFELFWKAPIASRDLSLFQDPGFGATNTTLGQTAGGSFGVEAYAVDDAISGNRVSLDLGARVISHFEGRGYSEMWEVFALAGDVGDANNPLILDRDPTDNTRTDSSHPGITNIEGFLETALRTSIRAKLGKSAHLSVTVDVAWKTDHAITFADAGVDLPTCPAANCENDFNDVVSPGTKEVNPLYNERIDLVGHRYRAEDSLTLAIGVMGELVF